MKKQNTKKIIKQLKKIPIVKTAKEEERILVLKNNLSSIDKNYHLEVYKILQEIFNLRKRILTNYTIKDLGREDIIKDLYSSTYITTIMAIQYITPTTYRLIAQKHYTLPTVSKLISSSKKLRDKRTQNRFFKELTDKKVTGKLNVLQLRESAKVFNRDDNIKDISSKDMYRREMVYSIRCYNKNLRKRFSKMSIKNQVLIEENIKQIYNFIKESKRPKKKFLGVF